MPLEIKRKKVLALRYEHREETSLQLEIQSQEFPDSLEGNALLTEKLLQRHEPTLIIGREVLRR